jgi:plastocyanin
VQQHRFFARPSWFAPFLALILITLGLAVASPAQANSSDDDARVWTVQVGHQSRSGAIQTMNYGPPTIWIDQGDTVRWVAAAQEIHTVSFVDPAHPDSGYSPTVAYMNTRTPQHSIRRPGQFRNSGILDRASDGPGAQYRSYSLTFRGIGVYHYLCYVHGGQMQSGTVVVRRDDARYPHTQGWYDRRTARTDTALVEHGLNLWDQAMSSATSHHVYVGAADMQAMVMRFIAPHVNIGVGDSITFDMAKNTIPIPHTVTFGAEPPGPFPVGNPHAYDGTGPLSSGIMLPPGFGPPGSSTFKVTFTKAGTYPYLCMLHDNMGMKGTITVQ